ncbi:FAD-dependent monooxygenase [Mucilaginibacter jinjuensis]|uniref:FAD-dependent monooxygenase n=1 Tax=Mucilaginibacter jinjuensis TaxID=1176721 RepID=A0ABY7T8G4_9SPHI|nr:FAD-dependent monooxygenase [Mucilaginibacter jinjuensis]WCT12706.1 FAD-dependent monooxygenase [Mucilaginibacter jinjuensis]
MNISNQHTKVLIVGAGPSGLMMAAQLLRYGIEPVIIDSKLGPTDHSQALAVQARSMEIYRQMGLVDQVLKEGKPNAGLQFFYGDKLTGKFPLSDTGQGETPYPYIFIYPQNKNERVLLGDLTKNTTPVYWNTSLTQLVQKSKTVEATVTTNGIEATITADWVIGADGAHSTVRKQSGIHFSGDTYAHLFYLADIISNHDDDYIKLHLTNKGFAGFFPTPDKNGFRVIGSLPPEFEGKEDIKLEDILPYAEEITQGPIVVNKCNWFTTYKLHHRMADKFRSGRCFLIGDAAHIHSPVGGQGMNTGLQDAYNLAWKLAGVINNKIHEGILNSYAAERMPVAKQLLETTDKAFNIIMSQAWWARFFKRFALPKILSMMWGNAGVKQNFFQRVSQLGINYRHSHINLHLSHAHKIKAGDRLPYLKLYDEKKQIETDLHAWCSKPGFTMIIFGRLAELELLAFARWITHFYGSGLNFFYLPPSDRNQHIFEAFEIRQDHVKTLVVRPDNYIGFMSDTTDIDIINNYMQSTTGLISLKKS